MKKKIQNLKDEKQERINREKERLMMVAYEERLKKGYESNDTAKGVLAPRHIKHQTENQRHLYIRMCAEYEIMLEEMRIYKLETSLK